LKGISGLLTDDLHEPALVLPITEVSVLEAPPLRYIEYDDMSSLTFPSSNVSNEAINTSIEDNVSGKRNNKSINSEIFK
jgi:hypothetical protein